MNVEDCLTDTVGGAVALHAVGQAELDAWLAEGPPERRAYAQAVKFRGEPESVMLRPGPDGSIVEAAVGLGEGGEPRLVGAAASARFGGDFTLASMPAWLSREDAVLGYLLGAYRFAAYLSQFDAPPRLALAPGEAAEALRLARAIYLVRDLVNTPASDMGPDGLEAAMRNTAERCGARFEVVRGEALLAGNLPMIHAVGRAAAQEPRLAIMRWGEPGRPKVRLIGKGVTFDSGGLDIKSSGGMRLMKKDMGGAAHVIGLAQALIEAGAAIDLAVYAPIVENAVSGDAFRPGDVLRSRKGITVEIDNTDAEGRLVLADAIAMACEDKPDLVIDMATLTGAARVALGPELAPFYTGDDALAEAIEAAARDRFDPVWRMPLWQPYQSMLKSKVADMANAGGNGMAGSITAALFLRRFVDAPAWVHWDVFAWNPDERPSRPGGGEAFGLRALDKVLLERYGRYA